MDGTLTKPKMLVVIPNMNMGGAQTALLSFLRTPLLQRFDVTVSITTRGGVLEGHIPDDVRVVHGFDYFALDRYEGSLKSALIECVRQLDLGQAFRYVRRVAFFAALRGVHPEEVTWRLVRKRVPEDLESFDVCISFMQGTASYFVIEKLPNVDMKILEFNTDFEMAGYSPRFNRRYFQSADAVVSVSDAGATQLQQLFPESASKIHHIPYAMVGETSISDSESSMVAADAASFDGIRLVSVGRLEIPAKGYDLLIDAARLLRDAGAHFRWWFVGDGGSRAAAAERIRDLGLEDEIVLTGTLLDPSSVLSQADIFVHGSRFEGTPRAVREAMTLGLPVVTTNYVAAVSEFRNGHDCLITQMDASAIASAIQRLIDDPKLRATLGTNGQKVSNTSAFGYADLLKEYVDEID